MTNVRSPVLLHTILGIGFMLLFWQVARPLEELIEIFWQVPTVQGVSRVPAALWVSFFSVSILLYLASRAIGAFVTNQPQGSALAWAYNFSTFLVLVYGFQSLHFIVLAEKMDIRSEIWFWGNLFEVLMVACLVAILWPFSFGLRSCPHSAALFLISLVVFGSTLAILHPDMIVIILASLNLIEEPRCVLLGDTFPTLSYLVPVPGLLWMVIWHCWKRQPSAIGSWKSTRAGTARPG
jgi:hypothetical protein